MKLLHCIQYAYRCFRDRWRLYGKVPLLANFWIDDNLPDSSRIGDSVAAAIVTTFNNEYSSCQFKDVTCK